MSSDPVLDELRAAAYKSAWRQYREHSHLTPTEKLVGPSQLRECIEILIEAGERDAAKIATTAVGLLREREQITRSKMRTAERKPSD